MERQVLDAMKSLAASSAKMKAEIRCTVPVSGLMRRINEVGSKVSRVRRLTGCLYLDGDTRVVWSETVKAYNRLEADLDRYAATAHCPTSRSFTSRSSDRDDYRYRSSSSSSNRARRVGIFISGHSH